MYEREQCVVTNGVKSSRKPVTSEIPLGSVLGPILFIIYVHDLPGSVHLSTQMFADDMKVFREIVNKSDCELVRFAFGVC